MDQIALAVWVFMAGCIAGRYFAEREHRDAIDFYRRSKAAVREVLQTRTFVGGGLSIANVGTWRLGQRRVKVTIEPDV